MKSVKTKRIVLIAVLLFAAVLLMPYAKAEFLTARYGAEFAHEYEQSGMIDRIEYFKVTSCSSENATVFYVLDEHAAGVRMNFSGGSGSWDLTDWNVIWSTSGSADGFCWPYYR